ncbi:class I SAM-dependent methyltransferase [Prauserella alba]|uniref:Class I SAM-dependent methyltransferase n=1 Tax=Prauserella alba TaxID=176898 RepID=A0ABN1V3X4_9PSEU|nr:class I SAM-dependent methyltransferase [Prauserella alba]MCP2178855.1 Methyltransferase domain-containing protein [Prauserella alba]
MTDEYSESAEFIDLLIAPFWTALRPVLTEALSSRTATTAVDLGAGSGHGTLLLAETLPGADVVAVEPSAGLRSALLARVHGDERLRRRVTVLPAAFPDVALPGRFAVLIAMNVLGHFDAAGRDRLWSLLAARLDHDGVAVVNLQPPAEPVPVPESVAATAQVGRLTYEGRARAEPTGDGTLTWFMTYRTLDGDTAIDERAVSYAWHLVDETGLRTEVAAHGLTLTPTGDPQLGVYTITHG